MAMRIWQPRLPAEYQEVEYIQSSGTQRIDTGYAPQTTTEFEIDYELVSYVWAYQSPFGTRYAHNDRAYYIWISNENVSYCWFWSNKISPAIAFWGLGTRRNITYHNSVLSNWDESITVATNQTPYWTIRIFCQEQNWTVQEYAAMKFYSFKLWEWSTLVRDYVPCYRKSDSVIWVYDIVNDQFYTNAGSGTFTKWNDQNTLAEKEIKSIKIWKPNVTDMQWPAPTWYHVPSKDERVALCSILTSTFGLTGNAATMESVLKMPRAGLRDYVSASAYEHGVTAGYWSSTDSAGYAYDLRFSSSMLNPQDGNFHSYGFSVRPFKDVPVTPDSNWTTLFDWSSVATGAWVFRDATNWLISISWDWSNWTTIMDKNLWATEAFTPWPWTTFTQANCWNYYQRWNNYGFPFTWTVTTSSTPVDASNYWPWNYYSSSTFIMYGYSGDWSSVNNANLWWWESKDTPIKRVTIRPNGVEKQIRPVWWLPYDNVYITNSWIYTGTDASPLTTQIKAATIYWAWYDREQNVIWMYTNSWVGWYDFDTDDITIVDSYTRTSRWW